MVALASIVLATLVSQIVLNEREDLALVVLAPSGEMRWTSRSEIYQIISETLRDRSMYALRTFEGAEIETCKGELGCLALAVNRGSTEARRPRYLIVLSVRAEGQSDRLRALLVDASIALKLHDGTANDAMWNSSTDAFEDQVFQRAVLAQPDGVELHASRDLKSALAMSLVDPCADVLFRSGAPGAIEIESAHSGVAIMLDGRAAGSTQVGTTKIEGVRPGTRELQLQHPDFMNASSSVDVVSGGIAKFKFDELKKAGETTSTVRDITFWSGVGAAGIGAVVTAIAIERQASDDTGRLCISAMQINCGGPYIRSTESSMALSAPVKGRGIPLAPLGLSLIATGAVWSIATWLGDQSELPWLEVGLGIALGAATLSVSLLLEPDR